MDELEIGDVKCHEKPLYDWFMGDQIRIDEQLIVRSRPNKNLSTKVKPEGRRP